MPMSDVTCDSYCFVGYCLLETNHHSIGMHLIGGPGPFDEFHDNFVSELYPGTRDDLWASKEQTGDGNTGSCSGFHGLRAKQHPGKQNLLLRVICSDRLKNRLRFQQVLLLKIVLFREKRSCGLRALTTRIKKHFVEHGCAFVDPILRNRCIQSRPWVDIQVLPLNLGKGNMEQKVVDFRSIKGKDFQLAVSLGERVRAD